MSKEKQEWTESRVLRWVLAITGTTLFLSGVSVGLMLADRIGG